jgi:hypothetical protein
MRYIRRSAALLAALVVTAGGAVAASTASASPTPAAGTASQLASNSPNAGFMIRSLNFPRCLDIRGGNTGNGASVATWTCTGAPGQRWTRSGLSLVSDLSGRCLDLADGNFTNGGAVNMWQCNGQAWVQVGNEFRIGTKCLDISGGNPWNGAAVQVWDCNGAPGQQWVLML